MFLSAVDIHNQFGYQQILPESIAVVYSPVDRTAKVKIFRVKDKFMKTVQNCQRSGFHEHKTNGEHHFEECQHVTVCDGKDNGIKCETVDLRNQAASRW